MKGEVHTRRLVKRRAREACERCGAVYSWSGFSVHHRKNRSQGGQWNPANCVYLCGTGTTACHGWVTDHPEDARAEGFSILAGQDEMDMPIQLWSVDRPVLLDMQGSWAYEDLESGGDAA